jgi:hypothetical protein
VPDAPPLKVFFRFLRLSQSQADELGGRLGELRVAPRVDKNGLAGWIPLTASVSPQPVLDAVRSVGAAPDSYGIFVSFIEEHESGMVRLPTWIADFAAAVHCPIDVSYTIV